jgi:4'-phosphopantetheinyl transferase
MTATLGSDRAPTQVFIADTRLLGANAASDAAYRQRLTPRDRDQLGAITSPKRYREFLMSRVLARAALRVWAGERAETWTIAADPQGRPYVDSGSSGMSVPAISLSHSASSVVCALCGRGSIGIDVEEIRSRDIDKLANEVLAASELNELNKLVGAARQQTFYRFWTLKEAFSKALGTGLATPFREIVFDLALPRIISGAPKPGERTEFLSMAPSAGIIGALVLFVPRDDPPTSVRFHFLISPERLQVGDVEILSGTFR